MANTHEGELELELEEELEGLGEFEQPELAHEYEYPELAHEYEHPELAQEFEQPELAHEHEEQFFGRIARGIGRFVRRAAPILRSIARVAAPMVGTAIGGLSALS